MLSGDLLNDLRKGHVHFEPIGDEELLEEVCEDEFEHEMDEEHIFLSTEGAGLEERVNGSVTVSSDHYFNSEQRTILGRN